MRLTTLKPLCTALVLGSTALSTFAIIFDEGSNVVFDAVSTNYTSVIVGQINNNNSLIITNGASVSTETGILGELSADNQIVVTGTNSSMRATDSFIVSPNSGSQNNLKVEDGGQFVVGSGTGIAGAISIGSTNDNVELSINNNSSAASEFLYVGTASDEAGQLTLSGNGTELIISDTAYIGLSGSNNTVTVNSGSSMTVSNLLQVGSGSSSSNNLNIHGETIIIGNVDVQNPDSNTINIEAGGKLIYTGNADLNDAADNGFNFVDGSTLEIGGALVFDQMDTGVSVILNNSLNTNLTSSWDTGTEDMYVGNTVGKNSLTIKDGASATAGGNSAYIGFLSDGNSITIGGSNSTYTVTSRLVVGADGSQNILDIMDGGSADIGTNLRVGLQATAEKNEVNISGTNATLTVTGNVLIGEQGSENTLNLSSGGKLDIINGSLTIGQSGNSNSATLEGSNTTASVGGDLFIGLEGDSNELKIESGAQLILASGDAYIGTEGKGNGIYLEGTNSYLEIGQSLTMGNSIETNDLTGNYIDIREGATISIGESLNLYNGSILQIVDDSQVTVGTDYYQDETSELTVYVSPSSANTTNLVVIGSATFASNTTIRVSESDIKPTDDFKQTIVSSSALYLGDTNVLATTDMLNDSNIINFYNTLLEIDGIVSNNSIIITTEVLSLSARSGLNGTPLEPLGDAIDDLAFSGNANAQEMRSILGENPLYDSVEAKNTVMLDYYGDKESSLPANNVIYLGVQNVADQVTTRADNTRARQGMASSLTDFDKPEAANGPHEADQELQGWINAYGSKGTKDAVDGYDGYDASMSGFLIGLDGALNENWLVGMAGGSGSASTDKDNASMDTKTIFGTGYASVGTKDWFADMGFVYGNTDVDARLGNAFDTTASYNAQNVALFLGGGKEIIHDYVIFTPELSFLGNYYFQENYQETATTAVGRKVRSLETFNLQSTLGSSMAMYLGLGKVTFKPEIRAFWLHEWLNDDEEILYSLQGANGTYSMLFQAPEQDILKLGIGTSARWGDYLELRADLDTRLGSNYSDYTILGSLHYQF